MVSEARKLGALLAIVCVMACDAGFVDPVVVPNPGTLFVAPDGDDRHDGRSSATALKTVQKALNWAGPGDVIQLAPGDYFEHLRTQRSGLPSAPIIVKGPSNAVVHGLRDPDVSRVFEVNHNHVQLEGFAIDGFLGGDPVDAKNYKDKLLYVQGRGVRTGVQGFKALRLQLRNAGGECVRLRYFARQNEIAHCQITQCGLYDFRFAGGGSNGEGIYIGTSPGDLSDGKNPTDDPDLSTFNHIHHNTIETGGDECIDVKEAAGDTLIEVNVCRGQNQPRSAGITLRSDRNVLRANEISGGAGFGLRLGGDDPSNGILNVVRDNVITGNARGGLRVTAAPQGLICGNRLQDNAGEAVLVEAGAPVMADLPCPD